MGTYSTQADLQRLVPNASGSLIAGSEFNDVWEEFAIDASGEIEDHIGFRTATPSSEDLAEVEAHLVAHRAVTARYQAVDQDSSNTFRQNFKERAYELLDNHIFPATASTPVPIQDFSVTGSQAISVTVYDEYTQDAQWIAKCITAGGATASFEIWNSVDRIGWLYDLGAESQFPNATHIDSASAEALIKSIKVVITGDDANPFTKGDTWVWRTYSRKRTRKIQGIGSIPIQRI